MDISFPAPTAYEGDGGVEGPPGTAFQLVDERTVQRTFGGMSTKKSPGPDGVGPLAIRCLYDWDPRRVEALIRTHVRVGVHPDRWKVSRGVAIPKPGKDDYSAAKAYRVISLLNCLGKMVEKIVAMLVSAQCELTGGFHAGQYGCQAHRSAVDAVGVVIARTQEAWKRGVYRWCPPHGCGGGLPKRGKRLPSQKDAGPEPGRVPYQMDRQLHEGPEIDHEHRRTEQRADGGHDGPPPGVSILTGPFCHLT